MPSIFSRIIAGEIPSYKVAETDTCYAFLDINPLSKGHVLCVPKKEVDYIFDLTDDEYVDLQLFAKRVAFAIKKALPCKRVSVAVVGIDVPHAHIHLVPLYVGNELNFNGNHLSLDESEMRSIADTIAQMME
ncbi:MAG: HIT family protein [Bacteroidales bacterium]|nr:HIT family protein [Candidatus Colimorpha onthohippi]